MITNQAPSYSKHHYDKIIKIHAIVLFFLLRHFNMRIGRQEIKVEREVTCA